MSNKHILVIRDIENKYTFFNMYKENETDDLFRVYFYNDMWDDKDKYISLATDTALENNHAILNSRYKTKNSEEKFLGECIQQISRIKLSNADIEVRNEKYTEMEHINDPRALIDVE